MGDIKKEIAVFLDTNILQSFIGSKNESNVFLYKAGINGEYYNLTEFIDRYHLNNNIEICIPSVVVMEIKQHMYNCFRKNTKQLNDDIEKYKKLFNSLLEIDYNIKLDEDNYHKFVDGLFDDFIGNPRNQCKIVQHSKDEELIETLLVKALSGIKPFFSGKIEGKAHSDAGFKDAIIAETIYGYCESMGKIGVFISQDRDFAEAFTSRLNNESKYVQFYSIKDTISALSEFFGTDPVQCLNREFNQNTYLHEYLLHEAGVELDDSVTERIVKDVSFDDENIANIKMDFVVNESIYHFEVMFDSVANDIIECTYKIEND